MKSLLKGYRRIKDREDERWFHEDEDEQLTRFNGDMLRRLLCEFLGTFFSTFASAGGSMIVIISKDVGKPIAITDYAFASGLLTTVMVYAWGAVSGSHFNPAVTLGFTLRGVFPLVLAPLYMLAQFLGGIAAAVFLMFMFGTINYVGSSTPSEGYYWQSFVLEILLTWLIVSVSLGVATRYQVVGPNAALASGFVNILCKLIGIPISGAGINPARSLGPAIISSIVMGPNVALRTLWIYLAGPFIGSVIAVGHIFLLRSSRRDYESNAAVGQGSS